MGVVLRSDRYLDISDTAVEEMAILQENSAVWFRSAVWVSSVT